MNKKEIIQAIRKVKEVQCIDGTWNHDPYMQGMANGLILALSIAENKRPEYLDAPEKWNTPENLTALAMADLTNALKADTDLLWGWHCVLATSAQDEGMEYKASNRSAARFMQSTFGIDTTEHEHFPDTQIPFKEN